MARSSPSQMSRSAVSSLRWVPSNVVRVSPALALRMRKPDDTLAASYAWFGWLVSSITRLDASTTLLIGRIPAASTLRARWSGDGPTTMPLITVTLNRAHAFSSTIFTGTRRVEPFLDASPFSGMNFTPRCAATSRATPRCPVASGRLRVMSRSYTTSRFTPSASNTLRPSFAPAGKIMIPAASLDNPSSAAEHSMPSESMPRIPRRRISRPSGIFVPSVASGTRSPLCMLNAPHHT